jgi:nucleoside-diphosphate-sugar epimerase
VSRVLVTGAGGFLGRHAVATLVDRGHEVLAVTSRQPVAEDRRGVRWVRCDLLRPEAPRELAVLACASHLLHLAWYAEHGAFWTSLQNLEWVGASLRLLQAFRESGGGRAVMAGTCAEYEWGVERRFVEGQTAMVPRTLYGAAKHGLSLVADAYARQEGLSLAWGRIFFTFGPGEAAGRLVPSLARALLRGEEAPVTHGEQVRDFLAVDELATAFAALLESPVEGAVNVASGDPIALRQLVAMVGEAAGRPDLIRYGAITPRPGEPAEIVADVHRLHDEVGWCPRDGLADSIGRTVRWWRQTEGLTEPASS